MTQTLRERARKTAAMKKLVNQREEGTIDRESTEEEEPDNTKPSESTQPERPPQSPASPPQSTSQPGCSFWKGTLRPRDNGKTTPLKIDTNQVETDKDGGGTKCSCLRFTPIQPERKCPQHKKVTQGIGENQETNLKPSSPQYNPTVSEDEELKDKDSSRMVEIKEEILEIK